MVSFLRSLQTVFLPIRLVLQFMFIFVCCRRQIKNKFYKQCCYMKFKNNKIFFQKARDLGIQKCKFPKLNKNKFTEKLTFETRLSQKAWGKSNKKKSSLKLESHFTVFQLQLPLKLKRKPRKKILQYTQDYHTNRTDHNISTAVVVFGRASTLGQTKTGLGSRVYPFITPGCCRLLPGSGAGSDVV